METRRSLRTTMLLAAAMLVTPASRPAAQLPSLPAVMREKADNAERLLRPLVLADFADIDKYADRLGRLTYTEIASWQARAEPGYLKQVNAFLAAVGDLREAASRRDAEGAGAAYGRLVASCVACHREARAGRFASIALPGERPSAGP